MLNILKWTSPPAGTGMGRDGSMTGAETHNAAAQFVDRDKGSDGTTVVLRRHIDFIEHQIRWRGYSIHTKGAINIPERCIWSRPKGAALSQFVPASPRVPGSTTIPGCLWRLRGWPGCNQR